MEDGNPNCIWMWVRIKMEFGSLGDAKKWILENSEKIQSSINLFRI